MHHHNPPYDDDAPAVFMADRLSVDLGKPSGRWIQLNVDPTSLRCQIRRFGLDHSDMVIIDQVGLGPVMVDEDASVSDLLARVNGRLGHWQPYR